MSYAHSTTLANQVCVQKPTFLLPTSPWGGNEVMLLRNTLICEDNGAAEISQGAVLSRMRTNAIFSFYFLIDRLISENCFRPQLARRETKKSEVNTQIWGCLPSETIRRTTRLQACGCEIQPRLETLHAGRLLRKDLKNNEFRAG